MAHDDADRTRSGAAEEVAPAVRVRRVQVLHGEARGALQMLEGGAGPYPIGRAGHVEGALALSDSEVSRHHASLEWDQAAAGFCLVDHGSRNGVFVEGARAHRVSLADGAIVRIGTSLLLYEDTELPAFVALEPETPTLPGPSLAMQRLRAEIELVARQPIAVLVLGDSGTGKELVAAEVHRQSGRAGALVAVNCSSISPELAESEIFGHAAGAFTGAVKRSEGLFAAAEGGTLFLDEIGEMPVALQPKLLRALAQGEVRAVGSSQTIKVDVRVIAATHKDLEAAAAEGTFRGDLLARLSGWPLRVAPLRQRRQDILALAGRFVGPGNSAETSADAAEALLLHRWPFNVRQLQQTMASASLRAGGGPIRLEHLPPGFKALLRDRVLPRPASEAPPPLALVVPLDRPPTREDLCRVLERLGGNMAEVAEFFRKDRRQIYRWAEKLGVDPDAYRKS